MVHKSLEKAKGGRQPHDAEDRQGGIPSIGVRDVLLSCHAATERAAAPPRRRGGPVILERLMARGRIGWGTLCAQLPGFSAYVWRRFQDDRCLRVAASLSYTSLLALVPMAAIGFAMLAAFPVFEEVRQDIQTTVFENLLPGTAEQTQQYFDSFVANAKRLTAVGIIGLAVTAVMLLGTIESAFNLIFRVTRPRAVVPRVLVFWAVITLGPILVGASFSLGTYLFAVGRGVVSGALQGAVARFAIVVPTLMIAVAFTLFYVIIPHRPVRWRHALAGGAIAGLMFSALRYGFSIYVAKFPTYQAIYGAVSALPIFLVWMYLSWTVVLLGAVITAGLPEWRGGGQTLARDLRPGARFALAIQILALLFAKSQVGRRAARAEILHQTQADEAAAALLLTRLENAGYAAATARGEWVLSRDLAAVSLEELERDLGFTIGPDDMPSGTEVWRRKIATRLADAARLARPALTVSLREVVAEDTRALAGAALSETADTLEIDPKATLGPAGNAQNGPARASGSGPALRQVP